ncbi:hypothetical protein [Cellulomonas humilata]|uniref:Uncharacterized protein n=1 Tax=Cellulomonas humilata TaxID=144055 RepID=A0ABU0EBI4_9CELL|nr:hypothetical protein [Cellulomonas humilata]MDQ0372609.1 hypothetical protein [Cellulomonas humilata]
MDEFVAAKVQPFYLKMMGLNATSADPASLAAVRAAASGVTLEQVLRLLHDSWRERVMGAWYSLTFPHEQVGDGLAQSMRTSAGSLTAPALATACVVLGASAAPALRAYIANAPADGSPGFVSAALEHVGGEPVLRAQQQDRDALSGMLAVARVLGEPDPPS